MFFVSVVIKENQKEDFLDKFPYFLEDLTKEFDSAMNKIVEFSNDPKIDGEEYFRKLDDLKEYIDDLFVAEATKPDTLQSVCDDIDIIISSLGVASSRSNDTISVKDVDYGGNRNLLDRALSTSVKKFIYVSFIITPDLEHLEISKIKKMFEQILPD